MTLTPADVRHVVFSKAPIGKRGYAEDEVDIFLDLVEAELARLTEENNDLRHQVAQNQMAQNQMAQNQMVLADQQRHTAPVITGRDLQPLEPLRPAVAAAQPPGMQQISPSGIHHVQTVKVLSLAQQIADRLTGEAKTEADGMLSTAQAQAKKLLSDARAKTDGMVNEARTRAETIVDDARTRAEVLDRQAREKAAAMEREAERQYTEIVDSISREKNILEQKIGELRTFESEYHARLKTYLESQLNALDPCVHTAPVDLPHQQGSGAHRAERRTEHPGADAHIPATRYGSYDRAIS